MPSSTTALVSGQNRYLLPTDALTIHRIEYKKNGDGDWQLIQPIIKEEIPVAIDEFMETDSEPLYYRLVGDVIELFPATDYSQDASLKIYYDRDSVDFLYTDTTETPGFVSPYHEILPIKAIIEWLKVKQPTSPTLQLLLQDNDKIEQSINEFYSKRFKSKKPVIGRAYQSFK
jgi:hypothetical protein